MSEDKAGMYRIDRTLLRQMIKADGGIRPFSRRVGLNRQTIYNVLDGMKPDYDTICRISEGLGLTRDQIMSVFFATSVAEE